MNFHRFMILLVVLSTGVGFGCQQMSPDGADATHVAEGEMQTTISYLQTPCGLETFVQDCATEFQMAEGDKCVLWPGVFCHPVDLVCSVTIDADCYFNQDEGSFECTSDADCDDANACTFETCVVKADSSFCHEVAQPNGSFCGYDEASGTNKVCEASSIPSSPNCVLDTGCSQDSDCSDGDPCTYDYCGWDDECYNYDKWDCTLCTDDAVCSEKNEQICDDGEWHTSIYKCGDEGICLNTASSWGVCENGCADESVCKGDEPAPTPEPTPEPELIPECTQDTDCADDSGCTNDRCSNSGVCQYDPITDCTVCKDDSHCAGLTEHTCVDAAWTIMHYTCGSNGTCEMSQLDSGDCNTTCLADGTCEPPECTLDAECEDSDACTLNKCVSGSCSYPDNGTCTNGAQDPILTLGWTMPATWNLDKVAMEGTYCADGAKAPGVQNCGSLYVVWGTFATHDMTPTQTVWVKSQISLVGDQNLQYVGAKVKIPKDAKWMIFNFTYELMSANKHWLCNAKSGPVNYSSWGDADNYGSFTFEAPDGTTLTAIVQEGNGDSCNFWLDVSSIAALNN